MLLKGGYTNYGQDIGVLMLDTKFPRIPGDIGNARTYPNIPLRFKMVKNAQSPKIMGKTPAPEVMQPFIDAAREMEAEGVKAITTSCGFLAMYQRLLADSVNVPVFTSALMLAPLVHTMINRDKKIGIFTERAWNMTEEHFNNVGWSSKDIPVVVTGMLEGAKFPALFIDNGVEEEFEELQKCMEEITIRHMKENPDTGAIIFECTTFGPWSKMVQDIAGVPVFGINQLVEYVASCVNVRDYREDLKLF